MKTSAIKEGRNSITLLSERLQLFKGISKVVETKPMTVSAVCYELAYSWHTIRLTTD